LAAQSGVVTGLRVATISGVIPPGGTILEIVPADDTRIVEAFIRPDDIDVARSGLPVNVRLPAISRRRSEPLSGIVKSLSPAKISEGQGKGFFRATVDLKHDASMNHLGFELQAGMTAELEIVTGEERAYKYLISPVLESMGRALREQ
tara:strand:- start:133 stop:576 length:444 start_codon:yes stop_codon:yes gene_type:complete